MAGHDDDDCRQDRAAATASEAGLTFQVGTRSDKKSLYDSPDGFYNPRMGLGRDLAVLAASTVLAASPSCSMLDAFAGVGVLGLRLSRLGSQEARTPLHHVAVNDISVQCRALIEANVARNTQQPGAGPGSAKQQQVSVSSDDASVHLRLHGSRYRFAHLDPFGTVVPFLDSCFASLRTGAVLSLCSTDMSTVCDRRYVNVARRRYGIQHLATPRCEAFREVAARIILAAVARAACRHDRGIDVLLTAFCNHYIVVQVRIVRGARISDATAALVRPAPDGQGPLWMGPLGCPAFLKELLSRAHDERLELATRRVAIVKLLTVLAAETAVQHHAAATAGAAAERAGKVGAAVQAPPSGMPFFVKLPSLVRGLGLSSVPKIQLVIDMLQQQQQQQQQAQEEGKAEQGGASEAIVTSAALVSRSHFDSAGLRCSAAMVAPSPANGMAVYEAAVRAAHAAGGKPNRVVEIRKADVLAQQRLQQRRWRVVVLVVASGILACSCVRN